MTKKKARPVKKTAAKAPQASPQLFPPFHPAAYLAANILLGGLGYILLREYKRFFAFMAIILVASFVPVLSFIILAASAVDAYLIAKRSRDERHPAPAYSPLLTTAAIIIWALLLFGALYY